MDEAGKKGITNCS